MGGIFFVGELFKLGNAFLFLGKVRKSYFYSFGIRLPGVFLSLFFILA